MLLYFRNEERVLNQMIQLCWLIKPCDMRIFDSEVLSLKCYRSPLLLGQVIKQVFF